MKQNIHRQAGWLSLNDDRIFYWLHQPTTQLCERLVILCPPIGYEYVHSHRTLKRLADQLAEAGCCVARLDYPGIGNSSSDLTSTQLVERWINAIGAVRTELTRHRTEAQVTLIGLRLGATLAVQALLPTDDLVLLEPVVNGKRMVRELTATAGFAEVQSSADFIESGGFIYTKETLTSLSELAITGSALLKANKIICFSERPNKALLSCLEQANTPCHSYQGYADMMAEPQYTQVPHDLLQQIVSIVKPPTSIISTPSEIIPVANLQWSDDKLVETCGNDDIGQFAVITQPTTEKNDAAVLVLINSGAVHHVGPNRTYTEFCRTAAQHGVTSVRFDVSNLGDSAVADVAEENHSYSAEAFNYVFSMLNYVRQRFPNKPIALSGICSGAHHAMHAALINPTLVQRLIIINPLTFYWEPGMSLAIPEGDSATHQDTAYYSQALKDPKRWLKLLKGQASFGYIAGYCVRYARKRFAALGDQLAGLFKPLPDTRLNRDLQQLAKAGIDINFVFSDRDPGWNILADETHLPKAKIAKQLNLNIYQINEANHTFSWHPSRSAAAHLIAELAGGTHNSKQTVDSAGIIANG